MKKPTVVTADSIRSGASRDAAVEGLRGLAALMVFYHHVMLQSVGGWSPSPHWTWPVSGPAAVLVFFVLSGYVIGLSIRGPADGPRLQRYLWRRAVRLVPINCVAVLLACAVATSLDLPTVLGNLFFLENYGDYAGHWMLVLPENPNLWSLNYEVVFYLLFAAMWAASVRLRWAVAGALVVGGLGWFGFGVPVFVACYSFGFLFWLAGLALSRHATAAADERSNWPSCLLLALLTWKLQPLAEILIALDPSPPRFPGPVVKLYHLDFLPACVWLLCCVARRAFPFLAIVRWSAVAIPLVGIALRLVRDDGLLGAETVALLGVYALALALWRWRPGVGVWERFAPIGLISYALYATARPVEIAVFRWGQELSGHVGTFAACALATLAIVLALSWYLERRLQPALARRLLATRASL